MIQLNLNEDIKIIYKQASSFPQGIKAAFDALENLVPDAGKRTFYGLSKPHNNTIVYQAGMAEAYTGEAQALGLETYTLKKGAYMAEPHCNWMANPHVLGESFQKLIKLPELDPSSYCIEWYQEDGSVVCMVKLSGKI